MIAIYPEFAEQHDQLAAASFCCNECRTYSDIVTLARGAQPAPSKKAFEVSAAQTQNAKNDDEALGAFISDLKHVFSDWYCAEGGKEHLCPSCKLKRAQ